MDLGFMPSYLGFKYFLVVIDAYTEKLWAVALKKKKWSNCRQGFGTNHQFYFLTHQRYSI